MLLNSLKILKMLLYLLNSYLNNSGIFQVSTIDFYLKKNDKITKFVRGQIIIIFEYPVSSIFKHKSLIKMHIT